MQAINEKYYGLLLFIGAIVSIIFYSVVLFGNYFIPNLVRLDILGVNVFNYELVLLISVWIIVMLICGLLVWLGFLLLIQPILEKSKGKGK